MKNSRVFVVGGARNYYDPFAEFGMLGTDIESFIGTPEEIRKNISLVLFTGGEDVSPLLYGEPKHVRTHCTQRDLHEVMVFNMALRYGLPMVGVCRGAQFLCVMAGGKLVQHIENHHGSHDVELWDGRHVTMSSTHHQMQLPPPEATVIGWTPCRSTIYQNGYGKEIPMTMDVEIVHYPSINAVGMQYHPEMMSNESPGFKVAAEIVKKFLMDKVEEKVA